MECRCQKVQATTDINSLVVKIAFSSLSFYPRLVGCHFVKGHRVEIVNIHGGEVFHCVVGIESIANAPIHYVLTLIETMVEDSQRWQI